MQNTAPPQSGPVDATLLAFTRQQQKRLIVARTTAEADVLVDMPENGRGPRYLIDPDVRNLPDNETVALIREYVAHSQRLGRSPIARPLQHRS